MRYFYFDAASGVFQWSMKTAQAVAQAAGSSPSTSMNRAEGDTQAEVAVQSSDTPAAAAASTTAAPPAAPAAGPGGSVGDRAWVDANRNGVQDSGEVGKANVTVTLSAFDPDAQTFVQVDSTTTDAQGKYAFEALQDGTYSLTFAASDGAKPTLRDAAGDDAIDSDVDADGMTAAFAVLDGQAIGDVDAGFINPGPPPPPDTVTLFEDTTRTDIRLFDATFGPDFKLVSVAHESAALDRQFKANGGQISFTEDGRVSYMSMSDYYGADKLVYVLEDSAGKQYTQTLDVNVQAVSDAPDPAKGAAYHPRSSKGDWDSIFYVGKVLHKTHTYKLSDFGKFGDSADALQDFGGYNASTASDADSAEFVRLYGLESNKQAAWAAYGSGYIKNWGADAAYGDILYKGKALDFSNGQTYDIPVADIQAGKLALDFRKSYIYYPLKFAWVDSGDAVSTPGAQPDNVSDDGRSTLYTPIALDLGGDGQIGVTGETASAQKDAGAPLGRTVQFDIDADGRLDRIEWFDGSGDGILIDDRDGQAATQMDGSRLFGAGRNNVHGYEKLAGLDTNGDGSLEGAELDGLALWVDDGDAVVQDGEIQSLAERGIVALSTQVEVTADAEGRGHLQSTATRADGSQILSEDVYFASDARPPALDEYLATDAGDVLFSAGSGQSETPALELATAPQIASAADFTLSADLLLRSIAESAATQPAIA